MVLSRTCMLLWLSTLDSYEQLVMVKMLCHLHFILLMAISVLFHESLISNVTVRYRVSALLFMCQLYIELLTQIAQAGKKGNFHWNVVKDCVKIRFLFINLQKFLEEKDLNIHLTDNSLKIANIPKSKISGE